MSKIFDRGLKLITILSFLIKKLQVQSLDFALFYPHNFSIIETCHWGLFSYFKYHCCFIEAKGNIIGLRQGMDSPNSLQTIIQSLLMLESDSVPNINDIVLSSWQNDRKIGMKAHCRNVVSVAIFIKGIKALLGLIVPHLYMAVVTTRYQVRAIKWWAEVNAIDTCLMTYKRVVSTGFSRTSLSWSWNCPYLDSSI